MNGVWQLQEAKSKFSEIVEKAIASGPQIVTKRGLESAVILSISDYKRLNKPKTSLLDFFNSAPKVDLPISRNRDLPRKIEL